VMLVWIGLYPQPILDLTGPSLDHLRAIGMTIADAAGGGA